MTSYATHDPPTHLARPLTNQPTDQLQANRSKVVSTVTSILDRSWGTYEGYTSPLGIGWMCAGCGTYAGDDAPGTGFGCAPKTLGPACLPACLPARLPACPAHPLTLWLIDRVFGFLVGRLQTLLC